MTRLELPSLHKIINLKELSFMGPIDPKGNKYILVDTQKLINNEAIPIGVKEKYIYSDGSWIRQSQGMLAIPIHEVKLGPETRLITGMLQIIDNIAQSLTEPYNTKSLLIIGSADQDKLIYGALLCHLQ